MFSLPRLRVPLISGLVTLAVSGCVTVAFHPDVPQGGRAVSIGVDASNPQRMLIASETGGLFRTQDGGVTWQHIDALPNYLVTDVAYAPGDPSVVIATASSAYRMVNDGGVWRSTDGGSTWSQPTGSIPPAGPRCGSRVSAYSVSFEPGSTNVYVATDCGLAASLDLGATWTHLVPDPTTPVNADKTQNRVWSVLAQTGGRLNLAAEDGLWVSTTAGASWSRGAFGPTRGQAWVTHAFAASPFDPRHILHAGGGQQLYLSNDGGLSWAGPFDSGTWNRPVHVRTARSVSGQPNQFDLYFGDGQYLRRRTLTHVPGAWGPSLGAWTYPAVDHEDPADVGFHPNGTTPVLLATDGGVHRTADNGTTWTLTGGGKGGFNALQITEVTGQDVQGNRPHLDLYFGTQDNGIRASADGGSTWPGYKCCEGFYLRTAPVTVDHAHGTVTGVACFSCSNFMSAEHLKGARDWPNPPDGDAAAGDIDGNPYLLRPEHYIQNTVNNDAVPLVNAFKLTEDRGTSWSPAFTVVSELRSVPVVAGPKTGPTVYQPVRRPGDTSDGHERIGLVRATDLYAPGGGSVAAADGPGFGSLGIFPTEFAWYVVLGVNPGDPDHLLMADIETDQMKVSLDAGQSWQVDPALTTLVTSGSTFRFRLGPFPLVSAIAFDPYNTCHILVGTRQNGVFRSIDRGRTWSGVAGSQQITNLSSFYFPPEGSVVVSSYGRGLWFLNVERTGLCPKVQPLPPRQSTVTLYDHRTGAHIPLRDLGTPEGCAVCQFIAVNGGRITDLKMEGPRVREIAISGGTIHQLATREREVPLQIPNTYATPLGNFGDDERLLSLAKQAPIRAILVEGSELRGLIASDDQLPLTLAHVPYVRVLSADMRGGVPLVGSGGTIVVAGEGFTPGTPVAIRIGDEIVAKSVPVDSDGRFRAEITVRRMPGDYAVLVEQVEGRRLTRDRSTVKVVTRDEPRSGRPQPSSQ